MTNNKTNDDESKASDADEKFRIYTTEIPSPGKIHSVYLSKRVEDSFYYTDLMHELRAMTQEDHVVFYLQNYGGDTDAGYQLINAIEDSRATTKHMVVDSECASMASIIALSGNTLEFKNRGVLMFHTYTARMYGKGQELESMHESITESDVVATKELCFPFLTIQELKDQKAGGDKYIHWYDKDLPERIKRHESHKKRLKNKEAKKK